MAGYTRQSAADIVAGQVIKAAPVHNEFQQVQTAFAALTGHKHDGSTGEGGYVPLIADVDALNKVVVDTANNRVSFYTEVGGVATEQLRIQDGAVVPVTDEDIDLGASGAEFKDLYIDGIGYIDSVVITGGTIDDTVIGGTTPAAASFTTMDTSGDSTVGGTLGVTGNTTVGGTLGVTGTSTFTDPITAGSLTTTATATLANVDINGGAIDGTIIGATSAAAGSFTTVSTSGQATLASADINGGTIDGAVIGGTSPQAVTGTTITANTGFTGSLTGNVTGNVSGNVTGNVTGDVTGNLTGDVTGDVTGDLTGNVTGDLTGNVTGDVTGDLTGDVTGNVTASTGTTTLNDLVVNGTVDFTSTSLLNVNDPTSAQEAATKNYVDTNDALKLNLSGGTMSGDITMDGNTVTGLGTPSLSTDAATKGYVDTADALKLDLAGGTMSGDITMDGNTVTGLGTPTVSSDAATKGYVDSEVAALVDAAPGALDTLNELAAAINDDANFSTTITNSIATKLPLAGGTMTGDIAMGTNTISGMADPTLAQDAATKNYVDTVDATKLNLSGGTMTGDITMGANAVTSTATPATDDTLTRKGYVDTQDDLKLDVAGGTMTGDITLGTNKATSTATPDTADTLTRKGYVDDQDALKLDLTGGTMSGAIAMGTSKITGLGDPTAAQDAATKTYVDTQDATKLNLSGGTMTGAIDMGANKITTTYTPTDAADLTTKTYVDGILSSATDAADSAAAAAVSETNAATSETNAANSASAAAASYDDFDDRYLGSKTSVPSVDNDGNALLTGALYWNSNLNSLFVWNGITWDSAAFTLGDALTALSDDDTPQLGGSLDLNGQDITGTGNVDINGNVSLTGTVDGRDVAADGTKLDTVETNADVTDTVNVTAAGALMDSEVTNLDAVKTFDPADYATAAQGTTADGALQRSGGTMTGDLILNADPTTALGAATKEYVDTIAAAGIHYHTPVRVEAPSNLNATYDNGTSGVGATLTNAGTLAAITIDGVALSLNDRVLIYNQTNAAHNGIYTVTTVGDGSTAWVLTRATDADSYAVSDPDSLGEGDAFFVKEGATGAGELYVMNTSGTITLGTTPITFTVIAETAVYSAGTDLTLTGTTFSLNPTITADTTGNAATATTLANSRDITLTGAVTGTTSFDGSGNVSIATTATSDPTITLTGAVTGSGTMTNLGDVSITTTATADPTLTLAGDASGSATFTNLGNATLTVSVANDSHTHDGRYYTEAESDSRFLAISAKAADSNLLDGIDSSAFVRSNANDIVSGQIDFTYGDGAFWSSQSGTSIGWRGRFGHRNSAADTSTFIGSYGTSGGVFSHNYALNAWDDLYVNTVDGTTGGNTRLPSTTYIAGNTVWHAGNDGAGSGLDADLLDGVQGSSYLRSDAADSLTASSQHLLTIEKTGTPANGSTLKVINDEGDHSWGIVGEFRVDGNAGNDRPSILFSSGYDNNTWSVGFGGSDSSYFRINSDHGYHNTSWGTTQLAIGRDGSAFFSGSVREDYDAISGTSPTCNVNNAGAFSLSMSGNTTFTFTSPSSNWSTGFILQLTGNGGTVTWPSSVDWAGGTAPDAPASGETDIYVFWTRDGGATWYGVQSIDAAA